VLLAFFLLLNTRSGLSRHELRLERLNRSRIRNGKAPLLDHVDVRARHSLLKVHSQRMTRHLPAGDGRGCTMCAATLSAGAMNCSGACPSCEETQRRGN
jgi:hypothetical protein